jgi:hypothetical protein
LLGPIRPHGLRSLTEPKPPSRLKQGEKKGIQAKFSDKEAAEISESIELALSLLRPIEEAVLSRKGITAATVSTFMSVWGKSLRDDVHWRADKPSDLFARTVGFGCLNILLTHAQEVTAAQAEEIATTLSTGRFYVSQNIDVLAELARNGELHEAAGRFAQAIAGQIRQDDNIGLRGEYYSDLAGALAPMSVDEAKEYYLQGLAQLDQMGGELRPDLLAAPFCSGPEWRVPGAATRPASHEPLPDDRFQRFKQVRMDAVCARRC